MPVAKSFLNSKIIWGPGPGKGGKSYVTIELPNGQTRTVRWYTNEEWKRMYPELAHMIDNDKVSYRKILGFGEAGYITVYFGNTYENLEWFKAEPECRYHKTWGWYTPSDMDVAQILPKEVSTFKLFWNDICTENNEINLETVEQIMNKIKYANENSGNFVGEIGERTKFNLTIKKVIPVENRYGISSMHIMKDENDNTFIWTTASKTLEVGKEYNMKGTIKDHREYRGIKQTILSRCTIL